MTLPRPFIFVFMGITCNPTYIYTHTVHDIYSAIDRVPVDVDLVLVEYDI